MPALLTRMSTWPCLATSLSATSVTCLELVTSICTVSAWKPSLRRSAWHPAATAGSTSAITTVAPASASAVLQARPMARPPPVTTATLPSSFSFSRYIATTPSKSAWHLDLHLDRAGRRLGGELEGADAVLESEGPGDERRHVDIAGAHHRDAAREDVGVAEDVLDPCLLDRRVGHVIGDRFHRHADEDNAAAGADRLEQAGRDLLVAGAFERDVDAPAVGLLLHHVDQVLRAHV